MANRLDYYFKQRVTEAELDLGFSYLEQADRYILADLGIEGILRNMVVVQHDPTPDLTVDVGDGSDASVAIDAYGQRVAFGAAVQNVNLALDSNAVSTAVASPGNSKIISLFIQFDRVLTDPRVDGNSLTVYFERAESFSFVVVQGAEAVSPTPPALIAGSILLADVTRIYGQTSFVTGDIDTSRTQLPFKTTSSTVAAKSLSEAFQQIEDAIAGVVGGSFNASAVNYGGGGTWNDGDTNPAASVEATLDAIFADLASSAGSDKIGAAAYTPSPAAFVDLSVGSIQDQLRTLADGLSGSVLAANITYAGPPGGFYDGSVTGSASVEATLDAIISRLGDTQYGGGMIAVAEVAGANPQILDGSVQDAFQSVQTAAGWLALNQTWVGANIFDDLTMSSTNKVKYASRSLVRVFSGPFTFTAGDWDSGGFFSLSQVTDDVSNTVGIALDNLPNGCTITKIRLFIQGAAHGTLPTTKPSFALESRGLASNSVTAEAGFFTDAPADTTAYANYHAIDSGTISVAVNKTTKQYMLAVKGEASPNFAAGLTVYLAEVTFTVTSQDEG